MMKPIKMNGIRLSDPHVLVNQSYTDDTCRDPVRLYQFLSADEINISFLNIISVNQQKHIACCVAPDKLCYVQKYESIGSDTAQFGYQAEIGTLSIYPHKFSLNSLGYLISILARGKYKFYHMASSTSSLTFVVDYRVQEKMAADLSREIDLPGSHTPFRQERCDDEQLLIRKAFPETVATYVESKIKCYGIDAKTDLSLCCLEIPVDQLEMWGKMIQSMETAGLRFQFASACLCANNRVQLFLLIDTMDSIPAGQRDRVISSFFPEGWKKMVKIKSPVAAIGFQGPHFGDRYGIANQAFSALHVNEIPFYLAGCSGASIQMVLPAAMLQKAKSSLLQVFAAP